ncbi:hypothetical protein DFH08DRAFT_948449 [Mycena albidolilacea]|uniref:Tf2-1-like SH3-like domain-containing protein n=1 Tax=Mycena albidolilacea TaxID=1033008 RepID=A0AAD7ARF8_9AGAR|nr:hypothetical protein DFH08DRAFT_948449 [Mycena albidolilacea]
MPRPQSADAPRFDGTNLTDFLDILSCHGERTGLMLDELTPLIIAYCTPDVWRVIRFSPELHHNARSWQDAVSELRLLYSSGDGLVMYTIADLREFCRETCSGSPFCSQSDAQAYARRFIEISGYLREFGFITEGKVQPTDTLFTLALFSLPSHQSPGTLPIPLTLKTTGHRPSSRICLPGNLLFFIGPFKVMQVVEKGAYKLELPPHYSQLHLVFPVMKLELAKLDPFPRHP